MKTLHGQIAREAASTGTLKEQPKMSIEEKRVRSFLEWCRDMPHHFFGWNEHPTKKIDVIDEDGKILGQRPADKSLTLRGHGHQKTVAVSTFDMARPYAETGSEEDRRIVKPNALGLQLLSGEVEFQESVE